MASKKNNNLGKRRTEYNKELRRIKSTLTKAKNKGYITADIEDLISTSTKPLTKADKAPTQAELKALKNLDILALKNKAIFTVDIDTGEAESKLQGEIRLAREKEKRVAETNTIISNARAEIKKLPDARFEHYKNLFKQAIAKSIKERGRQKTAELLQEAAHDKGVPFANFTYGELYGTDGVQNAELHNGEGALQALGISDSQINNALNPRQKINMSIKNDNPNIYDLTR